MTENHSQQGFAKHFSPVDPVRAQLFVVSFLVDTCFKMFKFSSYALNVCFVLVLRFGITASFFWFSYYSAAVSLDSHQFFLLYIPLLMSL